MKTQSDKPDGVFQRVLPDSILQTIFLCRECVACPVICDICSKSPKLIVKIILYANCDQKDIWLGKCKFIFYSFSISKYDLLTVFSCQTNQKTSQAEQRKLFYLLQEFCNLTCLILYVNIVKCPFPCKINKAHILYQMYQSIN